ncbi:hypothetical protein GOV06_02470 [Candidatus Woesearchaeota archaeon]|nr:hypothetical protein [Candidatus Woesearchaeota archaeon]
MEGLEKLAEMEYPGRVIIIGRTKRGSHAGHSYDGANVVAYGLSGRSESSQARKLKATKDKKRISIDVTDPEQLAKGDPSLLVYDAIVKIGRTIIVSNGVQTNLIGDAADMYRRFMERELPIEDLLPMSFCEPHYMETKDGRTIDIACYEPDDPNFTPRICGVVQGDYAMLGVIKRDTNGEPLHCFYKFPLVEGQAKMIATYEGVNQNPLPAFTGEPRDIRLEVETVIPETQQDIANGIYEAMGKFAVSSACMLSKDDWEYKKEQVAIKNLHEGE